MREKGGLGEWRPSMSGHGYLVAAWSDSLRFAFNLAEEVWMTLGLSPLRPETFARPHLLQRQGQSAITLRYPEQRPHLG